jgi:hypothetical protein
MTDVRLSGSGEGGEDGLTLAVRLSTVRPALRVLYMSGEGPELGIHRAVFLSKPFWVADLLARVRRLLGSAGAPASSPRPKAARLKPGTRPTAASASRR